MRIILLTTHSTVWCSAFFPIPSPHIPSHPRKLDTSSSYKFAMPPLLLVTRVGLNIFTGWRMVYRYIYLLGYDAELTTKLTTKLWPFREAVNLHCLSFILSPVFCCKVNRQCINKERDRIFLIIHIHHTVARTLSRHISDSSSRRACCGLQGVSDDYYQQVCLFIAIPTLPHVPHILFLWSFQKKCIGACFFRAAQNNSIKYSCRLSH